MIPEVIHYCWFGHKPLPRLAEKCIRSWQKYLPDFEIRQWNENNFDVDAIPFTAEAYQAGKYAFVSDYARFAILYEHGGVYLDTDVETVKSWDILLKQAPFLGVEETGLINPGLGLAIDKKDDFCRYMIDTYKGQHFINTDGTHNLATVCDYTTDYFAERGFQSDKIPVQINGITILPAEYLSPKSQITGKIDITQNTFAIHHYAGSWLGPRERFKLKIKALVGPAVSAAYINLKKRLTAK